MTLNYQISFKTKTKYILALDKGVFVDGLNHVFEKDLGGQGVAMVDNWLTVWSIPTVNCKEKDRKSKGICANQVYVFLFPNLNRGGGSI